MLILNIQYWEGDKAQAMALARLIADLEPAKRKDVTVLFSARRDCRHDDASIAYVGKKFNVLKFSGSSAGRGWPQGPNNLFRDSYQHCIKITRSGRVKAEAILFIEADCVPLKRDWINLLIDEYSKCGKMILGCWLEAGDCGIRHINGNCIIHKDFWKKNRGILGHRRGGWDADNAGIMMAEGAPSRLIYSDYGLGKPDYNPWISCDSLFAAKRYRDPAHPLYGEDIFPAWLHGPKIMDGIECVRKRLLNNTT